MFMRNPRQARKNVWAVLAPLVLLVAAGILLGRVPGGGQPQLPDPDAMALLGDGRRSSAEVVDFWQQRVADAPRVVDHRVRLAGAQLTLAGDTGDLEGYELAERTLLGAVSPAPEDPDVLLTLAAARAGRHDFAGALELADRVLADEPDSTSALLAAGDAQLELGHYQAAGDAYRRAAAEVGELAPVLSRLGRLEASIGSLSNAHRLAERALIDAANHDLRRADAAFYWFQLASYDFALGRVDAAVGHVATALEIDPGHLGSLELQGKVLAAAGDLEGAAAVYENLVGDGGAADLHGELAKVYERLGRSDDAAEQIRLGLAAAAEAADRFPAERRHLVGFLSDHDPVEARRLAELDLSERQDVFAHAWYAWTLYRTGDVAGARVAIDPALAYGTEDARLLYQAATILYAAAGLDDAAEAPLASGDDRTRAFDLISRSQELNPLFDIEHGERAAELMAELER